MTRGPGSLGTARLGFWELPGDPGEGQTDVALYNAVLGACVQSPGRSPQGLDLSWDSCDLSS